MEHYLPHALALATWYTEVSIKGKKQAENTETDALTKS